MKFLNKHECLKHDGLVIIDLNDPDSTDIHSQKNLPQKAYETAKNVLNKNKVRLIGGKWKKKVHNSNDDSLKTYLWNWKTSEDASIIEQLLYSVFIEKNYDGSLIIFIPDELSTYTWEWFTNRYFDNIAQVQEMLLQRDRNAVFTWFQTDSENTPKPISHNNLINFVLQLWRRVSHCGRAVIFCKPIDSGISDERDIDPFFCPYNQCGLIEYFDDRLSDSITKYIRTLLSRIAYKISPTVSEKPKRRLISDNNKVSPSWNDYSLQPKSIEYEDFLRQELGSRELAGQFLNTCCEAFSCNPDSNSNRFVVLPNELIVALGALRIARRLANWTLEGESFCCSITLFAENDHNNLVDFAPIIEIHPDVPFTFPYAGKIRKHAEAAQGEGLFMLVNASTGILTKIIRHTEYISELRHRRHEFFGNLVSRKGMIIHLRDQGFVEVYLGGELSFWYDGFEWRAYPFRKLTKIFEKHLSHGSQIPDTNLQETDPQNSDTPRHLERVKHALVDAIRILLDRRASSLIILLSDEEETAFEEVAYEQMRHELEWAGDKVYVEKLDSEALAGLLMVDGAHVINSEGKLIDLARRIDAPRPRFSIKLAYDKKTYNNLKSGIKKHQRFDEFVVRKIKMSDHDKANKEEDQWEMILDIFGHIDARKWKSINDVNNPSTEFLRNTDGLLEELEENISKDLCLTWIVELPSKNLLKQITIDNIKDDISKLLNEYCSNNNMDNISLGDSTEPFTKICDPETNKCCMLFPLFNSDGEPIRATGFTKRNIRELRIDSLIKKTCFKKTNRLELLERSCFAVKTDQESHYIKPDPWEFKSNFMGVGFQTVKAKNNIYWFALDNSIKIAAESRDNDLPAAAQREFRKIVRGDGDEDHAGTGTRAAEELAKWLPHSKVIKISSSGDVKFK